MGHHGVTEGDLDILSLLTQTQPLSQPQHPRPDRFRERRPAGAQDPLMIAAAAFSGPDVTRNHFHHEYFPQSFLSWCDDEGGPRSAPSRPRPRMQSQQAPRRIRLAAERERAEEEARLSAVVPPKKDAKTSTPASPISVAAPRRKSISDPAVAKSLRLSSSSLPPVPPSAATATTEPLPPLVVQCQVRTRIPTPHGHVFLHLYTNNLDGKEHLAFVADQPQMDAHPGEPSPAASVPFLRSRSLDSTWHEGETDMERIVRGAYVGRLSTSSITPSLPPSPSLPEVDDDEDEREPPLVRIHSECFTGEVIGSQRCDCGEQLDEAFRLISSLGRGVIVYLRQEGRGIGLMEKLRAYNLQDLGHDTVTANLLLGHGADMRTYDIAGAILSDLDVREVRLLTNNPDKIEQIEKEGITVVERVAMVPRSWTAPLKKPTTRRRPAAMSGSSLLARALSSSSSPATPLLSEDEDAGGADSEEKDESEYDSDESHDLRHAGVGMIGASVTRSAELDKYLRTKVERMGHLLDLPPTPPRAESPIATRRAAKERRARAEGEHHPLASSVFSLATDEGSVGCESGSEDCA